MKTWNDYKKQYAELSDAHKADIDFVEYVADFVAQIVEAREQLGISQAELAKMCGLKQSAISRIESLKSTPQLDTVIRILQPLGLKLEVAHQ